MDKLKPLKRYTQDDWSALHECANGNYVSYEDAQAREKLLVDALRTISAIDYSQPQITVRGLAYKTVDFAKAVVAQFDAEEHQ